MAGGGNRFILNEAALAALFEAGGMVWVHMAGLTVRATSLAKLYAPVRSGRLRGSITGITVSGAPLTVDAVVGADTDYALYVHEGTKPRVIEPKNGHSYVTFFVGGRKYTANKVNFPGTKAHPFLRRAMEEVMAPHL